MILLLGCLVMAAVQDIRSGKVSNRLIVAGLMIGSFFQIRNYQICGMYYFLRNVSIPVILLYLLFQMRVLGAGDIKLFSMIGSFLTMQELLKCMAYSFLAAGAGAVLFLAADKRRRQRIRQGSYIYSTRYGQGRSHNMSRSLKRSSFHLHFLCRFSLVPSVHYISSKIR